MKAVLLSSAVAALTACAIQPDAQPRDIPVDDRIPLDHLLPTPVTPATPRGRSGCSSSPMPTATGSGCCDRSPAPSTPPTADALLDELFKGPNPQEFEAGFESALPETARPAARRSPSPGR